MKKKTDIRDDDLLALALKDVKPLPGRTIKKTAKHKIINPKQPSEGLAAFDRHSVKPKHSIQRPVSSHGNTPGLDRRTAMRMKRGQMQIEGRLDLHGFHQNEARGALANFINSAFNRKKRCVLIITGKGLHVKKPESTGILRKMVPVWLNEEPNRSQILSFSYATRADGGDGALYVLLKRHRTRKRA